MYNITAIDKHGSKEIWNNKSIGAILILIQYLFDNDYIIVNIEKIS